MYVTLYLAYRYETNINIIQLWTQKKQKQQAANKYFQQRDDTV